MTDNAIEHGSGNVFADLGLPDPGERQTKARLALALNRIIKGQGLKQAETARLLGVPRPRFRRWSTTGLMGSRLKS